MRFSPLCASRPCQKVEGSSKQWRTRSQLLPISVAYYCFAFMTQYHLISSLCNSLTQLCLAFCITELWRPWCYSATGGNSLPSTQTSLQCEAERCMHQRMLLERVAYLKAVTIITDVITPMQKKDKIKRLNQLVFHVGKLNYFTVREMLWLIGYSPAFDHLFK